MVHGWLDFKKGQEEATSPGPLHSFVHESSCWWETGQASEGLFEAGQHPNMTKRDTSKNVAANALPEPHHTGK